MAFWYRRGIVYREGQQAHDFVSSLRNDSRWSAVLPQLRDLGAPNTAVFFPFEVRLLGRLKMGSLPVPPSQSLDKPCHAAILNFGETPDMIYGLYLHELGHYVHWRRDSDDFFVANRMKHEEFTHLLLLNNRRWQPKDLPDGARTGNHPRQFSEEFRRFQLDYMQRLYAQENEAFTRLRREYESMARRFNPNISDEDVERMFRAQLERTPVGRRAPDGFSRAGAALPPPPGLSRGASIRSPKLKCNVLPLPGFHDAAGEFGLAFLARKGYEAPARLVEKLTYPLAWLDEQAQAGWTAVTGLEVNHPLRAIEAFEAAAVEGLVEDFDWLTGGRNPLGTSFMSPYNPYQKHPVIEGLPCPLGI